jgi:predicted 3-demethylubiquinone-9 3-methyltransferase (glyoxalase superfamily)
MASAVSAFLMFEGCCEEALNLYVSTIPDSRIIDIRRYGAGAPGKEGSVMLARASLGGLPLMCNDSSVHHAFTFTPSSSLFVTCRDESEFDKIAGELGKEGAVLMAPANYGFSRKFTWFNDRFGVSWQLSLE